MSTIVACKVNGVVAIGCDTQAVDDCGIKYRTDTKLIRLTVGVVLGLAGYACAKNAIHSILLSGACPFPQDRLETGSANADVFLAEWVRDLRKVQQKEWGVVAHSDHNNHWPDDGSAMLVATRDRIFEVTGNGGVDEAPADRGFAAIGSGARFALGALYRVMAHDRAEDRVVSALEAAAHFDVSTAGPFDVTVVG